MKFIKIFVIALFSLALTGCYEQFDMPAPQQEMTDEVMQAQGMQHLTIAVGNRLNNEMGMNMVGICMHSGKNLVVRVYAFHKFFR